MKPQNCWEFRKCGREPGGLNATLLGVCPATTESAYSGTNRGTNAGRYCWRIAGTFCEGRVSATFTSALMSCSFCDFFEFVQKSEGDDMKL